MKHWKHAQRIEQTKAQRRERTSPLNALDAVLTELAALREQDPQRYRRELEKIRLALDPRELNPVSGLHRSAMRLRVGTEPFRS